MYAVGIVGHGKDKFTEHSELIARKLIDTILVDARRKHGDIVMVSGHSPVGGIDIWAEESAQILGIPYDPKIPTTHQWDAPYGYKARNIDIAKSSNEVHIIVVSNYPAGYSGRRFDHCYHCDKHPGQRASDHIKSGGCWTGWKAWELRKECSWHVIRQS
jgi:hypothetical protein